MYPLRGGIFNRTVVLLFFFLDFSFSTPERVTACAGDGNSPSLGLTCATGTIRITKGICVLLDDCSNFTPSLESDCENSDYTEMWAPYCATTGESCTITASCSLGSTCPGDYTYGYADYECLDSMEDHVTTISAHAANEQRRNSLFKLVHTGRCLKNHAIKVKPGLTSVKCGSECNNLDECVSFNIGTGVCQLNSRLAGDRDVTAGDLEDDERSKYYEKVEKK